MLELEGHPIKLAGNGFKPRHKKRLLHTKEDLETFPSTVNLGNSMALKRKWSAQAICYFMAVAGTQKTRQQARNHNWSSWLLYWLMNFNLTWWPNWHPWPIPGSFPETSLIWNQELDKREVRETNHECGQDKTLPVMGKWSEPRFMQTMTYCVTQIYFRADHRYWGRYWWPGCGTISVVMGRSSSGRNSQPRQGSGTH